MPPSAQAVRHASSPATPGDASAADSAAPPAGPFPEASQGSDDGHLGRVEALMAELAGDPARCLAAEMVREHLAGGGKRLRARLALEAAHALGRPRRAAVEWAAACELLHNATLVHDDLQDGDALRRGRAATWVRYGRAQAVNAGDLMLMLPFAAIERVPACGDARWALASALARLAADAARGQAAEQALASRNDVSWDAYRRAADGKAGALFQLAVEGAAILAGRSAGDARALAEPFRALGVLFQLQDDVLDLYGDKGRGAPGADLREGKVSALVVEHLALHPQHARWLLSLLALPRAQTPEHEVEWAIERFRDDGALERVLERIAAEHRAVAAAPALAEVPALRSVALQVARAALAPIAHVRPGVPAGVA